MRLIVPEVHGKQHCFAIHAKREVQDCKILQLVLQRQVVKLNIDINSRKLSL